MERGKTSAGWEEEARNGRVERGKTSAGWEEAGNGRVERGKTSVGTRGTNKGLTTPPVSFCPDINGAYQLWEQSPPDMQSQA